MLAGDLAPDLQPPRGHVHPTNAFVRFERDWLERSIPECFADRASRRHADRVAISGTAGDLTYRELDRLSDRVGRAVVSRRSPRPEPVAFLLEHEAPVPAVMLGVLKAGTFFVPLDPSYPLDRNRYIVEDSQAEFLITNERNLSVAASLGVSPGRLLNLDEIASAPLADYPSDGIMPDDLAYVLYTSGSTGEPKGVMRTHRGLLHNAMRQTNARHVHAGDRIALLFSYSFESAVVNAFIALLSGATLLPFNLRELGVARLADWLSERDVTQFHTVPTVFRHFTDVLTDDHAFPQLRLIQLGGETMFAKDVERFKKHFGAHCLLTVGMGTAESGHVFEFGVGKDTECPTDLLPVGYPVDDTEVLLLDAHGQPVGIGRVGEIAVRGSFVSPGYWRRPELTAKAFRPDPDGGNARIYLTGDLGCMLPDGCVFHLGRNDARVRIRGHSVEIPEVEAALLRLPWVSEAAVAAEEDRPGDRRLVAYVVPSAETRPSALALRRAMSEKLPAYMMPSTFVVLDALPLLPNGKVDRRALPAAKQTRLEGNHAFVAPRTSMEDALAKLWADVLGMERVGVEDNFFDLGGHSLLAMRLCGHIEKTFGKRLPLATLFQAPTVEQLAGLLSQDGWSAPLSSLVALQPNGSKSPFFWVHGENSNAFLPRYLPPDQPLYGLLHQSRDGTRALYTRLEDIAAHYLRGLRNVQPHGPYFLGGYCVGGTLAFEIAQQLQRQGEEVALLILLDPPGPRDGESSFSFRSHSSTSLPDASLPDAPSFGDRMYRRWRHLARLGPQAKLAYVWGGVSSHLRGQLTKITDTAKKVACNIYSVTGMAYALPPSLRIPYIEAVHHRARRSYVPQVYPGRVVIFTTEGGPRDPRSVWGRLATGGLDVYAVPGRHTEIVFNELHIQGLAKQLTACLDRAQATGVRVTVQPFAETVSARQ